MSKKISCRVIKSVPLSTNSDVLRCAGWSNNKCHKVDDVVAVNFRGGGTGNSARYTSRFGVARESIENDLLGQILDCYV